MQEHECPAGHTLARWRNRVTTLRCDGPCGQGLSECSWRWSCSLCDYDICDKCADGLLLAKSSSPDAAEKPVAVVLSATAVGVPHPPSSAIKTGAKSRSHQSSSAAAATPAPAPAPTPAPASAWAPAPTPVPAKAEEAKEVTPALGTGRDSSWIYSAPNLGSVKRDLDVVFPGSAAPSKRKSSNLSRTPRPRPSECVDEQLVMRVVAASASLPRHGAEDDDEEEAEGAVGALRRLKPRQHYGSPGALPKLGSESPSVLVGLPELSALLLPESVRARLQGRRAWLQHLLETELEREQRVASGQPTGLEEACGVPAGAPVSAEAATVARTAVLKKFERERHEMVRAELLEIETLHAMGKA
jgi:hypothetical protein